MDPLFRQEQVLGALLGVLGGPGAAATVGGGKEGGVAGALVEPGQQQQRVEGLKVHACGALKNVSAGSAENRRELISLGGVEALLQAARAECEATSGGSARLLIQVTATLRNLVEPLNAATDLGEDNQDPGQQQGGDHGD